MSTKTHLLLFLQLWTAITCPAFGQELRTLKNPTVVYSDPSVTSTPMGNLPLGKRVQVADERGNFFRVASRTGRKLWIEKINLGPVNISSSYDIENDIENDPSKDPAFKRIRFDMGASGGSMGSSSFVEGSFGMEYFMMERLSWRNALFYRFTQTHQDVIGLDSSVRGNGNLPLGALGLRGIIGAGYRFATRSQGAPFGEVGGFASVRGFAIGVMAKYLWNSISDPTRQDIVIYSVVLSGASGFF